MKTCPYCAEKIQDDAVVCRYCGKELRTTQPTKTIKRKDNSVLFIIGGVVLFLCMCLIVGSAISSTQKYVSSDRPIPTSTMATIQESKTPYFTDTPYPTRTQLVDTCIINVILSNGLESTEFYIITKGENAGTYCFMLVNKLNEEQYVYATETDYYDPFPFACAGDLNGFSIEVLAQNYEYGQAFCSGLFGE